MASSVTFTAPGGMSPTLHITGLARALKPSVGDCLWAGQLLRSQIRLRTQRGTSADGAAFPPYSERYKAQKAKALGHANVVDLFGFQPHPHMLNAILVKAGSRVGAGLGYNETVDADSSPEPGNLFTVGFWNEDEAMRARVHNEGGSVRTRSGGKGKRKSQAKTGGSFNMPKREFLKASAADIRAMENGIGERMLIRANRMG